MTEELKSELPPGAEGLPPGSRHTNAGHTISGWSGQNPGRSTPVFLAALHGAILHSVAETGSFSMKQLDHRAEHYLGVSNKEVTIHAREIVGRPIKDYGLAKLIVLRTLMQNACIKADYSVDPDLAEDLNFLLSQHKEALPREPSPATSDPADEDAEGESDNAEAVSEAETAEEEAE